MAGGRGSRDKRGEGDCYRKGVLTKTKGQLERRGEGTRGLWELTGNGRTGDWGRPGSQGGSGSRQGPCVPGSRQPLLAAQNFTASGEAEARRCARREELLARGCPAEELEEPRGRQEVLRDEPLSQGARGEGAVQLAPQRVRVTLRPGESRRSGRAEGWAAVRERSADSGVPAQGSRSSSGSASFAPRDTPWTYTTLWT